MLSIKVEGVEGLRHEMRDFSERRVKAAVATGLTKTVTQVRDNIKAQLPSVFDRPSPYTSRNIRYLGATAKSLEAVVGFNVEVVKDMRGRVQGYTDVGSYAPTPAGKYLQFQVDGGQRRTKRFEKALQMVGVLPAGWVTVPGQRAKLDAYGNQSPGELRQILSWFDAAELVAGSRQNMRDAGRDKRRQGTRKTAGFEYYVVQPGESRAFVRTGGRANRGTSHKAQPGIYRRTMTAFGSRVEPVVIFVKRAVYRKRFNFYGAAQREADRILPLEMERAVRESAARLAARGVA